MVSLRKRCRWEHRANQASPRYQQKFCTHVLGSLQPSLEMQRAHYRNDTPGRSCSWRRCKYVTVYLLLPVWSSATAAFQSVREKGVFSHFGEGACDSWPGCGESMWWETRSNTHSSLAHGKPGARPHKNNISEGLTVFMLLFNWLFFCVSFVLADFLSNPPTLSLILFLLDLNEYFCLSLL